MLKNLYAYTANAHPYPEYLSINAEPDGTIRVHVRGGARPGAFSDQDCGPEAGMTLPAEQLEAFATALRIAANNLKIMGTP